MKTLTKFSAIALVAMLMSTISVQAQRGYGKGNMYPNNQRNMMMQRGQNNFDGQMGYRMQMLNLTDDQQEQISQLRTKHLKEVTPLRNELNEKRARLHTLQTAEKPNQKEIDKVIDEMATIRANIQKKGSAHRIAVSNLLTEEQKVVFNSGRMGRMGQRNMGMRRGNFRGAGW